jgi:Flp pilus assembly protein TadG
MRLARDFARKCKTFASNERANVMILFGFAAIPLFGMVGAAVDYSQAANLKTKLQAATDATALFVAREADKLSDSELAVRASKVLLAELPNELSVKVDSLALSVGRTELTMKTSAVFPTSFMDLFGIDVVPVTASTMTVITNDTYEIALVLDNSGSMSSSAGGKSKMSAAKEAAKKLVNIMLTSPTSKDRTEISLVPFTLSVKVGAGYKSETWLDHSGLSSIHWQNLDRANSVWKPSSRFDLFSELGVAWGGCVESRPGDYGVNDAAPSAGAPDSLFVPQFAPDEPGPRSSGRYSYAFTLSGATTTYSYPNSYAADTIGTCTTAENTPDKSTAAKWAASEQKRLCKYKGKPAITIGTTRGPNYNCDAIALTRKTKSETVLNTSIDSMVAAGNTDLLEGFTWGWRTLSPSGPFADGKAYGEPDNNKVMIFMTDGMNNWAAESNHNKSIYSPFGYFVNDRLGVGATTASAARTQLDNRTLQACTNAKNAGITVYTVGFSVSTDPIDTAGKALLQNCASSPKLAYIASNSTEIVAVFEEIARNIGGLLITQ